VIGFGLVWLLVATHPSTIERFLVVPGLIKAMRHLQLFWYVPCWHFLKRLSQLSPLVDWHKLTYLVLFCRKTPINQSITQCDIGWTSYDTVINNSDSVTSR